MSKAVNITELPEQRYNLSPYCKDISGETFGELTVIYPSVLKAQDGSILWVCKCSCEEYTLRTGPNLKRKRNHHCGAQIHNFKDMEKRKNDLRTELNGKVNNFLEVIDFDHIEGVRIFLKCKCLNCGNTSIVRKDSFLDGHVSSCGCLHSKGESKIKGILQKEKINFLTEYSFLDLKDIKPLRFDFALLNDDMSLLALLEYQGKQHTVYDNNGWNTKEHFEKLKFHDDLKKEYCRKNNIKLYYITFEENIEERMEEIVSEIRSK